MGLAALCSAHWSLVGILALLAQRASGWSFVTADGTVQIASPINVQPSIASMDAAISFSKYGDSYAKWKMKLDGSDQLLIQGAPSETSITDYVKFDLSPLPSAGNYGVTVEESMKVSKDAKFDAHVLVGGDTKLQGHFALSANENVDLSSGGHSIDETFTVVTTGDATNQVSLPVPATAGQMFYVCNTQSMSTTIGATSPGYILDSTGANASTASLGSYECRQFISDGTKYLSVTSSSSATTTTTSPGPGATPAPTPPPSAPSPPPSTTIYGDLEVTGDVSMSAKLRLSTQANMDLTSAPFDATKTFTVIAVADATNSLTLPDTPDVGQVYYVCNNHNTSAKVQTQSGATVFADGASLTSGPLSVPQYQCRQFIGDGMYYFAINSAHGYFESITMVGDLTVASGEIRARNSVAENRLFADSLGKTTLGGGPVDISAYGSATTIKGSLTVQETVTIQDVTIGAGNISASNTMSPVEIYATTTGKVTLGGGELDLSTVGMKTDIRGELEVSETATFIGDIMTEGGDITANDRAVAQNIYATTTGKVSLGGGPVDLGVDSSVITVKGNLKVEGEFIGSAATMIDLSGGNVNANKMINFIGTADNNNQIRLPTSPEAGEVFVVCNTHATDALIGAVGAPIVDGGAAGSVAGPLKQHQCKTIVSGDSVYYVAGNPKVVQADMLKVDGVQVVGPQQASIASASATVPGVLTDPATQGELEQMRGAIAELQTTVNSLITKLQAHGLIGV